MFSTAKMLFFSFIFICFSSGLYAQDDLLEVSIDENILLSEKKEILIPSVEDKNIFYIDLELVEGHLSDLQILDETNQIVMNSSLKDIPADAMYELDLSQIEKGTYIFRIRTYKDIISEDIIIE